MVRESLDGATMEVAIILVIRSKPPRRHTADVFQSDRGIAFFGKLP